jgi:predicted metal-dependent phosphoesterase TrpH
MGYKYETHLHTCQGSLCGVTRGRDYIRKYKELGFTGIMVTDHFYNSNTAADRHLSWEEWVNAFCAGFEEAREEGAKLGLDVFFGWEETFDGDDYLVYGLDKNWLLAHPELVRWTREEQFREVHRHGGCVVQAHPFRQHDYIREVHLMPFLVDGIEAANAGNHEDIFDGLALEYARLLGLPVAAGSDIHRVTNIPEKYAPYGVELAEKLNSAADYAALIRNRADIGLFIPPGRCGCGESDKAKRLRFKVDIRDRNGRPVHSKNGERMSFNDIENYIRAEQGKG